MVLRGRQTNDEQTFVKFDKALATGGVAGGVATGENPTPPFAGFSCFSVHAQRLLAHLLVLYISLSRLSVWRQLAVYIIGAADVSRNT